MRRIFSGWRSSASERSETLVIGCGNEDRGDDAAGLIAVRRLRELGVPAREHRGDALSLIESWRGAKHVLIIDATFSGGSPGALSEWDGRAAPVVRDALRSSTHAMGVAEAIDLARVLDRLPPVLTVYGIEGARFEPGAEASPEVAEAAERLARRLAAEWKR